jgi:hypothetical protein
LSATGDAIPAFNSLSPPPNQPTTHSITAGDLLDTGGSSACANAAWNDDVSLSSGSRLCAPLALGGFDADCMHTAWGGITLGDKRWGMMQLYHPIPNYNTAFSF